MNLRKLLLAGGGAVALGVLSIPVAAAPSLGGLRASADETSPIVNVAYRSCWRNRYGRVHCRYVRRYYRSYGYAPYYDDDYYGYGPGLGLYFGGGGWHGGHFGGGGHGGHHR